MRTVPRRLGLGLGTAVLIAIMDQASKAYILALFAPPGNPEPPFAGTGHIPVLPFLDLVLAWNRGISFGMGNTGAWWTVWVFSILALAIGAYLVWTMAHSQTRLLVVAQGLVVGGAIGNVSDRLRLGAVVDFLYVHIGAFDWWPAFNLADSAICIGAGLWILSSLFGGPTSIKNTA